MNSTMPSYRTAIWPLLIAYGGAVDQPVGEPDYRGAKFSPISHYGGSADISLAATKRFLDVITEHGIDFEASDDPATDSSVTYNDTENQGPRVTVLYGVLVAGDGTAQPWTVGVPEGYDGERGIAITDLLKMILHGMSVDDAIDRLRQRLADIEQHDSDNLAQYHFARGAEIPA